MCKARPGISFITTVASLWVLLVKSHQHDIGWRKGSLLDEPFEWSYLPCPVKLSADVECRGLLTKCGVQQCSISAFIDDLTVTTLSVHQWKGISESKEHNPAKKAIGFVQTGEEPQVQWKVTVGLLTSAGGWQLKVILGKQFKFPESISETKLSSDVSHDVQNGKTNGSQLELPSLENERNRVKQDLVGKCQR